MKKMLNMFLSWSGNWPKWVLKMNNLYIFLKIDRKHRLNLAKWLVCTRCVWVRSKQAYRVSRVD